MGPCGRGRRPRWAPRRRWRARGRPPPRPPPWPPGLKDTVPERPYHSYLIRIRIQWKFRQNSGNLIRIHQKFWNLKTNQHFLWYLAKFRENFIKICEKINENYSKIAIFQKINEKIRKSFTKFCWDFHIQPVQRNVNLVDLEKCWKMRIWTQKSALMQKRTSRLKFAELVVGTWT